MNDRTISIRVAILVIVAIIDVIIPIIRTIINIIKIGFRIDIVIAAIDLLSSDIEANIRGHPIFEKTFAVLTENNRATTIASSRY